MGNIFLTSQTKKDMSKLDVILNTALRLVYGVRVAREVHTLDLYTKSNLFSLSFHRQYFLLNIFFFFGFFIYPEESRYMMNGFRLSPAVGLAFP